MCIYSNAPYNTLWGTLPDCFMEQFTIFLVQQVEFTGAPRTERVMPDHNTGNFKCPTYVHWMYTFFVIKIMCASLQMFNI